MTQNQQQWVLGQLLLKRPVTSMIAFRRKITRLSSIIFRLRQERYPIKTTMKQSKNKAMYASYRLIVNNYSKLRLDRVV